MIGFILFALVELAVAFPWLAIPLYLFIIFITIAGLQTAYEFIRYSKAERAQRKAEQQAHLDTVYTKEEQAEGKATLKRCFWFALLVEVPVISYLLFTDQVSAASILVAIALLLPASIVWSIIMYAYGRLQEES